MQGLSSLFEPAFDAMTGHHDMRQTTNGARRALERRSARPAARRPSAAIASMRDGLVTVDEDGRIVDVNAALCDMTRFHRLRLLGSRAPYPFWTHADAERNARTVAELLKGELAELLKGELAEGGSCQLTFCRPGGERFEASVAIAPLRDADGGSIGFTATIRELVDAPAARHDTPVADALVDGVRESGWRFRPVAVEALRGLVGAGAAPITRPDRSLAHPHPAVDGRLTSALRCELGQGLGAEIPDDHLVDT
jgi:PAS domain S-box-containing protein